MDKATFDKGLEIGRRCSARSSSRSRSATADDFNRPMQELTTEYCWGYVWGRERLDKKTRSMLNLAMISASTGRTS